MIGGGSAFWVLVYGLYYWASRLQLDSFAAAVLYLGYLILIALLDFLVTGECTDKWCRHYGLTHDCKGTIGFIASYWAVRRLYSSIRID